MEIERDFGLLEESIPQVSREAGINPVQDIEKTGFECPDRPFICIAEIGMGRENFLPCLTFFSDGLLVGCTDFIVQNLEIHLMAAACEPLHDGILRCDTVSVASHLRGGI